jgi:hypothetical protein
MWAAKHCSILFSSTLQQPERFYACNHTRLKIVKINNLFQVDINRREQGCAAHYEQYCQHVVTALFNCNNLEQHGNSQFVHSWPHNIVHACRYQLGTTCAFLAV